MSRVARIVLQAEESNEHGQPAFVVAFEWDPATNTWSREARGWELTAAEEWEFNQLEEPRSELSHEEVALEVCHTLGVEIVAAIVNEGPEKP